ncbi:MAG: MotA/TolQ/ExbB proton channel family protein [Acidobacteria bacterium]|nr:MotA/TolQ/ExbB proton channel family protein [Acidobacteriota bacterium]
MRTLGSLLLALQVQGGGTPSAGSGDVITLIAETTPINQGVLAILVLFSVASWAIILQKTWSFRRSERDTTRFLDVFRRSSKFSEVQAVCPTLPATPLVGVFQAGYAEINAQFRAAAPGGNPASATAPAAPRPILKSLDGVDRALIRAATGEVSKLERRMTFLATTAGVTPFIGLFGTVVGIMIAFQRIGATGSTNLAIVAPGISEALISTAAGLFAAIPALIFYNHFTHRVKEFSATMDDFALEFLNIAERNFT